MYQQFDASDVIGYTQVCPECGEEVYEGRMPRHMAKDHDPFDEAVAKLSLESGVPAMQIYELVEG